MAKKKNSKPKWSDVKPGVAGLDQRTHDLSEIVHPIGC